MAHFTLDQTASSEKNTNYVYKHGLIFRAGDYKDKEFSLSESELADAVANFSPVEIDVEHLRQSPLDGKLGRLEHVLIGQDGKSLYGTVRMPKWFHDNVYVENGKEKPIKVSTTWAKSSKRITKLAITENPRVDDAVLMAAFSNNRLDKGEKDTEVLKDFLAYFAEKYDYTKTNKGQGQLQELHDLACRYGAVCSKTNKNEKNYYFASVEENNVIQKVHDMAVSGGAGCDFKRDYTAEYSREDKTMSMRDSFNKWLDSFDKGGSVELSETPEAKEIGALKAKVEALEKEKAAGFSKSEDETPVVEAPEIKALREKVEALENEKMESVAASFAAEQVQKAVIPPAVEKDVANLLAQLSRDDKSYSAEVTFSNDGKAVKGSRVDAIKAIFAAIKPNALVKEEVANAGLLNEADFSDEDLEKEVAEQAAKFAKSYNKKVAAGN